MNEQIFSQLSEQMNKFMQPMRQANALFLKHAQELTDLQLAAAKDYAALAIEQMRAALSVTDVQALQTYLSQQAEVAGNVSKKIAADSEAVVKLNQQLATEVQKLVQESAVVLAPVKQSGRRAA